MGDKLDKGNTEIKRVTMKRYRIEFTDDQVKRLEELKDKMGVNSKGEVIRRALQLLSGMEADDTVFKSVTNVLS